MKLWQKDANLIWTVLIQTWNVLNLLVSLWHFWIYILERGAAVKWVRMIGFEVVTGAIRKYCTVTTQLCMDSHPCALYRRFPSRGASSQWQVLRSALFSVWPVSWQRARGVNLCHPGPSSERKTTMTWETWSRNHHRFSLYHVCAWIRLRYDRKQALWIRPPTLFSSYYGNYLWLHMYYYEQK